MGVLCLLYMLLALRTNLVFVGIFFTLVFAFGFLTAAYWNIADGHAAVAARYIVVAGAFVSHHSPELVFFFLWRMHKGFNIFFLFQNSVS